ncbi:VanZ family protein [Agromyces sp. NPDC058484]|uniref:VanZ family protein n=1 Tax=Agromyces sp. NPDC058484 TaxID=3346524 RepID=UPI0036633510
MTPPDRARPWALLVLAICATLLGLLMTVPRPIDQGLTPWIRSVLATLHRHGLSGWVSYDFVEYALHAVLFIPLGILAVVATGRQLAWLATLAILTVSAVVELAPSLGSSHPWMPLDLTLNVSGALAGAAIGFWAAPRRSPDDRAGSAHLAARTILAPYLVALALIVFLPARDAGRVTGIVGWAADLVALWGIPREPAAIVFEFLANVALFVPFGALLAVAAPRWSPWLIIASGCLASIIIELIQLGIPSRFATVSDVIANTAGTTIGCLVVLWWRTAASSSVVELRTASR